MVAIVAACAEPKQSTPKDPSALMLDPRCPGHPDYVEPHQGGGYGYEFAEDPLAGQFDEEPDCDP